MEMKALFDTNILIDYLAGVKQSHKEIKRYSTGYISSISWIEVLVGVDSIEEERVVRSFLSRFSLVPLSEEIAEAAVQNRRLYRLKVPDAIILASAQTLGALLITRNTKDFEVDNPGVRVPYKLKAT